MKYFWILYANWVSYSEVWESAKEVKKKIKNKYNKSCKRYMYEEKDIIRKEEKEFDYTKVSCFIPLF